MGCRAGASSAVVLHLEISAIGCGLGAHCLDLGDLEEVSLLVLPDGVPVLRQLRTVLTDDDRPVEVSVLIKGAHLYELQYQQPIPDA
jgi:hypothetical protein